MSSLRLEITKKFVQAVGMVTGAYCIEKQLKIFAEPDAPPPPPPLKNYIQKDDTQRNIFLSKYPRYDGRGIKIAIIDSAVDLSLDGLQKTSEGLPKVIDCFDFTGAGDVDTSVIREMDAENTLIGLSGRRLKIPSNWKNPSGKWHLGLKSLYEPTFSSKPYFKKQFFLYRILMDFREKLFSKMDCIVWYDGEQWLACIETDGDLENAKVLTDFRDKHEYGILSSKKVKDRTYCITVHNEGNLLEIFTPYCSHGSAVAQVAAAHFPKNAEEDDALAPGAQIISMNVLDPFVGNCMTNEPLKKALRKCIEMKVDIVNYSIRSFMGDKEAESLINEMVEKHNILIFKSAGNHGPCYSTVLNQDLSIEHLIFRIGALVTQDMKDNIYNVRFPDETPPTVEYYSSRGPAKDGNRGIDFVAPGACIADIPRYNSEKNIQCRGTSFSSPNAAGAVACLLSGLKANSVQYSPFSIKFALFKTAHLPKDGNKLEFGHGIIQADSAFEYCKNNKIDEISSKLWSSECQQSIYVIQKEGTKKIKKFVIDLPVILQIPRSKWKLQLSSQAKNYIKLHKIDKKDAFVVEIDTAKLQPGTLNYSEIQVMHPLNPSTGPIFNIPVTVIVPLKISGPIQKEITLNHENPYHIFVKPPPSSGKKCEINITPLEHCDTQLSVNYAIDGYYNKQLQNTERTFEMKSENSEPQIYSIPFESKEIYKICVFQGICSPSTAKYKLEFSFVDAK